MISIDEHFKTGQFKEVYLLYGSENFLKRNYKEKLIHHFMPEDNGMNLTYYSGNKVDVNEIILQANMMPFMVDHRVIVLENTGLFQKKNDELADLLEHWPDTSILIAVEEKVDMKLKTVTSIAKIGLVQKLDLWDEKRLSNWIGNRAKKMGKTMTQDAWKEFYERTGMNTDKIDIMEYMEKEFDKLSMYCLDQDVITKEDVEAVCTGWVNAKIFKMMDAIAKKDEKEMLGLYKDMLLESKEEPLHILNLIEMQFMQLLELESLLSNHASSQVIHQHFPQSWLVNKNRGLHHRLL